MKKEVVAVLVAGFLVMAYVLDAVVNPLPVKLSTPYHYFAWQTITLYPFTSVSIFLKAGAVTILPFWLLSFMPISHLTKGAILLVLAGLLQLYALQDVATSAHIVPLEWAIAFTLAGIVLLLPAVLFLLTGSASKVGQTLSDEPYNPDDETS